MDHSISVLASLLLQCFPSFDRSGSQMAKELCSRRVACGAGAWTLRDSQGLQGSTKRHRRPALLEPNGIFAMFGVNSTDHQC